MITSSLIAVRSIYSTEPQDCTFWAWCSLCLACSFVLFRYSLMVKSVKCLLLSLIEVFLIFGRGIMFPGYGFFRNIQVLGYVP